MSTYRIKESFLTIQGEGYHAGTPAVFLRFAGCNIWTGREEDRALNAARGACAQWCDTDFNGTDGDGGGVYSCEAIMARVADIRGAANIVVLTGGEPALQVDESLVRAIGSLGMFVHIETNGSKMLPHVDWVTLSPKPPMPVVRQRYDEVKVVYPSVDPLPWRQHSSRRFVQPRDGVTDSAKACVDFVLRNPGWRLSCQTHKMLGLR